MRRNVFKEAYCTTAKELKTELKALELKVGDVAVRRLDPPDVTSAFWHAEVCNGDTEPVCYVEGKTEEEVREILRKAKLKIVED